MRVEKHGARRRGRGRLTKIDERLVAIGHADQHEAAAAQISGFGEGHGQRIRGDNRRIDRIPAFPEHCDTGLACEPVRGDDHAVLGPLRWQRGGVAAAGRQHEQQERQPGPQQSAARADRGLQAYRNETGGKAEAFPPGLQTQRLNQNRF